MIWLELKNVSKIYCISYCKTAKHVVERSWQGEWSSQSFVQKCCNKVHTWKTWIVSCSFPVTLYCPWILQTILTHDNLANTTNRQPPDGIWLSSDHSICILHHRDVCLNFTMLGITSSFACIVQYKSGLKNSYLVPNSCDSLHTYSEYMQFIDGYTPWVFWPCAHHVRNHANAEFAPVGANTTRSAM